MKRALIVIDAQEDFVRGALRNEEAIKALPTIKEIVDYAYEHIDKIIYTKDTHGQGYLKSFEGKNLPVPHCIQYTAGWRICPEVMADDSTILIKHTFGYDAWFSEKLNEYDEIWLCGFCTDICVSANYQTIKATAPEVPIFVIEDACAGVTPELHEAALKVMKSCQARIVKWSELKDEIEPDH